LPFIFQTLSETKQVLLFCFTPLHFRFTNFYSERIIARFSFSKNSAQTYLTATFHHRAEMLSKTNSSPNSAMTQNLPQKIQHPKN